ncbi:low-molecular-weight cysteine-rich protein LCR70 precursor [Zea mays]|uniref:Low-molecular-weight cysteine-rich protein LCR70 n=1 Tax=Zea mays TaxID=4577 RepID=B6SMX5_MAIZE|nr:low-molecular-weight cysteine-rich protein LCR70 precursor [Zea mays]ACG26208.1 low-molecular-weight cysteine-rich protein LCR70 precursor [Zea mays]ACG49061.1 low-molecular-weight cysteine-rich protein LCR70 precursor [Zea mays]ONM58774.1 hypothetical protein ZEAMMB73_Zm00001d021843 [Zea mays]|eukprot:NP_001152704.1 low-molecular-weight cysteine-rich protein LCR70 precursor [Zea mays]
MKAQVAAATVLVLLLLTFAAEARTCMSRSQEQKGRCFHDTDCAAVCVKQSFTGGLCNGRPPFKQCFCTKPCKRERADATLRSSGL